MRVQIFSEISQLHAELGATMIYVTHDQVEAMTMGDRIYVMRDGLIMQIADPLTLYRHLGEKVAVQLDLDKVTLFDPSTEAVIN